MKTVNQIWRKPQNQFYNEIVSQADYQVRLQVGRSIVYITEDFQILDQVSDQVWDQS